MTLPPEKKKKYENIPPPPNFHIPLPPLGCIPVPPGITRVHISILHQEALRIAESNFMKQEDKGRIDTCRTLANTAGIGHEKHSRNKIGQVKTTSGHHYAHQL